MQQKRKNFLIGLSAIITVSLLALAVIGYSVYARVNDAGGLKSVLQTALNDATVGISTTIEDTEIGFQFSAAPFRLKATNIRLEAQDTALTLPSSEFGFSLFNLMQGRFVPSDMRMSGLEIEIVHGDEGWHAGPSMALITALMRENAENAASSDALSSIRNIFIGNAKLVVKRKPLAHHGDFEEEIVLSPIAINMQHNNNRISGRIQVKNAVGGAVDINFSGNETGSALEFTSSLNRVNMRDIYPYLGINMPEISDLGHVYGRVAMQVEDRKIIALSGDLTTDAGQTRLPALGAVEFSNASILFDYDAVVDRLTVTNFDMTTKKTGQNTNATTGVNIGLTTGQDLSGQINFAGELRGVNSNAPMVTARLRGTRLGFDRLMTLLPNQGLRQQFGNLLQGGRIDALGVDLSGVMRRDDNFFEITGLDLVTDLRAIQFKAGMATVDRLEGTLGARLEFSLGQGGLINHAKADFLLRDATLVTSSSDREIDLEGIELRTQLDGNTLTISRGAIDARSLGQMALVAKIDLLPNLTPHRFDLSIKAEQIDKELFTQLWPKAIQPRSRAWIDDRINGGVINGLAINMGIDLSNDLNSVSAGDDAEQDEVQTQVIYLDGKANLANTEVTFLEGLPPIKSAFVPIRFQEGLLRADLEKGVVDGINVSGSRVIIRKDEVGPMVDVAVLANGDFAGALRLIDSPRLNLLKPAGLSITQASGLMDASMSMKWHMPPRGKSIDDMGGMAINMTASIAEANLAGLPGGFELTDSDMEVILSDDDLSITGRGWINDAPSVMTLSYQRKADLALNIALEKTAETTAIINAKSGLSLTGETSGFVQAYKSAQSSEVNIGLDLDFSAAALNMDRFGLIKLPGEDAFFSSKLTLEDGQIKSLTDIDLDSDFLSIKGDAHFDESGGFLGAFFDTVSWPGNDISKITIDSNADDVLRISADAKIIDLTPLRREDSPGEGMSLDIDLTANRIVLDEKVSLSGNVSLKTEKDGMGNAAFLGTLYLSGKPFMTESSMTALFGSGGDLMEGRGLIGGAEASISLSPSERGGTLMVVRSNNAGQVLKTLNILDGIRSGKLNMVTEFDKDDSSVFETNFELEDFRVIEAPTAVRMMSVLSLAGMYSLVEGDGTHFNLGHARVEGKDGRVIIHQARASGDALAVDLVGYLEPETRQIEVSGMLLPLYGITKLIGKVPLVGQILTGIDNAGFFATQFSLSGTIDDPETSVNVSSIAPGVFRDVFSPDWINRERERLIPDENAEEKAAAKVIVDRITIETADNATAISQ